MSNTQEDIKQVYSVRFTPAMLKRLRKKARKDKQTVTSVIEQAVEAYLTPPVAAE